MTMLDLSEEQRMLVEGVRRAAREKIAPRAAETDLLGRYDWEVTNLLWDLGLLNIILPEEHGGWGQQSCYPLCLCVEEVAKVCASSALNLIIQAVGSFPLVHAGNSEQKARFLPRLGEGRQLMGYLVTEPGAGSDVAAISTKATLRGGDYILEGRKVFATNGGVAGLYSVLAKTGPKEFSFFVVERDSSGLSIGKLEDKCGFRGSNTAEVILDGVAVPAANLLGRPGDGFLIAMADFDMSRPAVAALALGIAEGALDYTLRYADQRQTFGKALLDHQVIAFMLADAAMKIEAGRGLMTRSAQTRDQGQRNTELSSMAKCFCSDMAMEVTTDMVQILGGYGYIKDFPLERMFRDAKLTQIFEGANQIQRGIISREMKKRLRA